MGSNFWDHQKERLTRPGSIYVMTVAVPFHVSQYGVSYALDLLKLVSISCRDVVIMTGRPSNEFGTDPSAIENGWYLHDIIEVIKLTQ